MNTTNALLALLLTTSITNTILSAKDTTTTKEDTPIQCTMINPDRDHAVSSPQGYIDYYTKTLNDLNMTKDRIVHTTTLLGTALICYR